MTPCGAGTGSGGAETSILLAIGLVLATAPIHFLECKNCTIVLTRRSLALINVCSMPRAPIRRAEPERGRFVGVSLRHTPKFLQSVIIPIQLLDMPTVFNCYFQFSRARNRALHGVGDIPRETAFGVLTDA